MSGKNKRKTLLVIDGLNIKYNLFCTLCSETIVEQLNTF